MAAVSNHEEGQSFTANSDIPKARFVVLTKNNETTDIVSTKVDLAENTGYNKKWSIGVAHLGAKKNDVVPVLTYPGMRVVVETGEAGVISAGQALKSDSMGRAVVAASDDPRRFEACYCTRAGKNCYDRR